MAQRAGGIEQLVAPRRLGETQSMSERQIQQYLLEDPSRIRRPIIDTGTTLYVGFSSAVQEALSR